MNDFIMKKVGLAAIVAVLLLITIISLFSFAYKQEIKQYNAVKTALTEYHPEEYKKADANIYFKSQTITEQQKQQPLIINEIKDDERSEEVFYKSEAFYVLQFAGPVRDSWKKALETYDVKIYSYIPQNSFIVKIPTVNLNKIQTFEFVKAIIDYNPEYKLNTETIATIVPDKNNKVTLDLYLYEDGNSALVAEKLKEVNGLEIIAADNEVIRIKTAQENIQQISAVDEVQIIDAPSPVHVLNDLVAQTHEVVPVWNFLNLNGKNQVIGILDTGLDTGVDNLSVLNDILLDFDNRIVNIKTNNTVCALSGASCSSPNDLNGHGTHVTGSAAGNGTLSAGQFKGMAYAANISFYAAGDDDGSRSIYLGTTSTYKTILHNQYLDGARVHSNSYGGDTNAYESLAVTVDDFMWNRKDALLIVAAGNSGGSGANTVFYPATAKNAVSVGNLQSSRSSGNPALISSTSSLGPAADNRTKPDVVVIGTNVVSTKSTVISSGSPSCNSAFSSNGNYSTCSGTSMATPSAAGMLVLLRQDFMLNKFYNNVSGALLKATLINGAQELSYGFPSNTSGWGRVNMTNTLIPSGSRYLVYIDNSTELTTGQSSTYNFTVVNASTPIKITLVWTDYKGTANAAISLVNDLNLIATAPNGTQFLGNNFLFPFNASSDDRNTVEQVIINTNNTQTGSYQVNVSAYNIAQGSQPFSLVISAGLNASPQINTFNGITSNPLVIPSLYNTSYFILENTSNGKIIFNDFAVAAFQDFDKNANISRNNILFNNSHLHSTLNSNITFSLYNTGYANPVPMKNGSVCNSAADGCTIITATATNLTFYTIGLANITARENASLITWDSTQDAAPYRLGATYENQIANFFANYTNVTSKTPITTANCSIQFTDVTANMMYNATKALFEYNRTFVGAATYNYNIICNETNFINQTAANTTTIFNSTDVKPFMPGNLTIKKLANNSINISWDSAKDASQYKLFFSENASYVLNLSAAALPTANATISAAAQLYYIDNDARDVDKRFYRVAAANGTNYNLTNITAAKFNVLIKAAAGNPTAGIQLNLISLPITVNDLNISNLTSASENDIIYSYNTTSKTAMLSQFFTGSGWLGDFTLFEYGRSYAFSPVATAYNITLVGEVPLNNYTTSIAASTNAAGNTTSAEINMFGYYSAIQQCNFSAIFVSPANPATGDRIYHYNTTSARYEYAQYSATTGLWSGNFACFEPGEGYEIRPSKNSYSLVYGRG
ncbi:S8 family serine peptidase [Candidatus Woesearchaeota archaeon]|nr:S8 family serine peptidase [Candidatus Woesearchaeota archaeon]